MEITPSWLWQLELCHFTGVISYLLGLGFHRLCRWISVSGVPPSTP
jgi:hypothetical protein